MYIQEVCNICANKGTECGNCVHNEEYEDLFQPLSEEDLKKREERQFEAFRESLVGEKLAIAVPKEFLRAFDLARKFSTQEPCDLGYNARYWDVFCGEDFLMATDGHALAKIRIAVPGMLAGKHLIDCSEDGVTTAKLPSPVFAGEAQRILNKARNDSYAVERILTKQELKDLFSEYRDSDGKLLEIQDGPVIQKILLDKAVAAIADGETVSLRYHLRSAHKQLLIEGQGIECLIMPVRTEAEVE